MLKLLSKLLKRKPAKALAPGLEDDLADDTAPIFEGLAMTEELRDALFPKSPQMISAVFDRPAPLQRPQAVGGASLGSSSMGSSGSGGFSIPL